MLEKCKTVILISDVPSFCNMFNSLAESIGVKLISEPSWNKMYRIDQDLLITGSAHIEQIN